jgi:methionyl-tRNA formyltransferase
LRRLRAASPSVGLHASGVIYRQPLLDVFTLGVLNAHIGLLPRYRGRSVLEWSLFHGDPTGITVFFVDSGIDTGPRIVLRREVNVSECPGVVEAKRYLFSLDGDMFADALMRLQGNATPATRQAVTDGTRWYVMSSLFTNVASALLSATHEQRGTAGTE